ncbi:hypothetical protein C479_00540 [Halovivax asiaticus JCM 14624]|uniref:Uncharacterized protein n=1 Tax=Halovivax asiaticus JCM 14624 TaxID=1227490 RepID=M0BTQ8_9EURY|nr:hypothetical protein [Halovivax asiaticus]ELZ14350.1 hypothetical protein C479_00540 [Halovivax asiaticus JCM 14624]
MPAFSVDAIRADGTDLECTVSATGGLSRFLSGDPFRVSYDRPIDDVPRSVLIIPVLSQLCPVAWARGGDVRAPVVDQRFARSLAAVRDALGDMHSFIAGGQLRAPRRRTEVPDRTDGSGLLFTGGVDSTASYVRHRDEAPTLVSIRGWTITPDAADDHKWDVLRARVNSFAKPRDLETAFVESNMLRFLDHPMLLAHYKRHVDGAWYSSVGHGLGLTGLCAPLAYASGIGDLYVAATHWEGIDLAWGSRPDIDGHVRWAGVECHHDGYELTRQERLDLLATYAEESPHELELQTCNDRLDGNCGRCEKCYRTAIGLRLAGLDPIDHGYRFTDTDYRTVRESFERGHWVLGIDERHMWADIRDRARETTPRSQAERAFFAWLDSVDLDELVDSSRPPLSHRVLRAGARAMPTGVYRRLYPLWSEATTIRRRLAQGRN